MVNKQQCPVNRMAQQRKEFTIITAERTLSGQAGRLFPVIGLPGLQFYRLGN
ncbi:MAG: hypothetical protein JWM28_2152 [Chitinophagaceae bacterium]|nr:hypothetical protein [Chitinophagaceae bacterium]